MSDVLADYRNAEGGIDSERLSEAVVHVNGVNMQMQRSIELQVTDILAVLEQYVVSIHGFLAAQIMDLANEQNSMWNLLQKVVGSKAHKASTTNKDLDDMNNSMQLARVMALHNLLKSKGGNESGLLLPDA